MLPCEKTMLWIDAPEQTWAEDGTDSVMCDELTGGVDESIGGLEGLIVRDNMPVACKDKTKLFDIESVDFKKDVEDEEHEEIMAIYDSGLYPPRARRSVSTRRGTPRYSMPRTPTASFGGRNRGC